MAEEVKAPRAPKRVPKKKVCTFCVDHVDDIDYKDVANSVVSSPRRAKSFPVV